MKTFLIEFYKEFENFSHTWTCSDFQFLNNFNFLSLHPRRVIRCCGVKILYAKIFVPHSTLASLSDSYSILLSMFIKCPSGEEIGFKRMFGIFFSISNFDFSTDHVNRFFFISEIRAELKVCSVVCRRRKEREKSTNRPHSFGVSHAMNVNNFHFRWWMLVAYQMNEISVEVSLFFFARVVFEKKICNKFEPQNITAWKCWMCELWWGVWAVNIFWSIQKDLKTFFSRNYWKLLACRNFENCQVARRKNSQFSFMKKIVLRISIEKAWKILFIEQRKINWNLKLLSKYFLISYVQSDWSSEVLNWVKKCEKTQDTEEQQEKVSTILEFQWR